MKILILEDDPLQQFDITQSVIERGHSVVGPFSDVTAALDSCGGLLPDAALIDYNLGGGMNSDRLADLLIAKNIPFVLATGYNRKHIAKRFSEVPILDKPYADSDIVSAIESLAVAQ